MPTVEVGERGCRGALMGVCEQNGLVLESRFFQNPVLESADLMPGQSALHRAVSFDKQLAGASGGWLASIGAVAKPNSAGAPYCIPNELICSEIGRFLRLPLPPAGIICSPSAKHRFWFASLDFNLTGNSLPPVDATRCVAELPDMSSGLILFDVLVGNADRHTGNFSVDFLSNPPQMNVFDHSHALCGCEAGRGKQRLSDSRDKLAIASHCLLSVISSDDCFRKWIDRIRAIPDFLIEDITQQAATYGLTTDEASEVQTFLKYRRERIEDIIKGNKTEFKGIAHWSML
jgi:hypothetical protein